MNLNENGKNEIRKMVEELVEKVPEGQKIKLPKDVLEDLIFYHIRDRWTVYTFPIWTGPFLRKIDLSEIEFTRNHDRPCSLYFDSEAFNGILKSFNTSLIKLSKDTPKIDFSYTNIDVKDFFEALGKRKKMRNCNLEGIDLSSITIYLSDFTENRGAYDIRNGNNFKNTGVRIITNSNERNKNDFSFSNLTGSILYREEYENAKKMVTSKIKSGFFDGCYYNGLLIEDGKIQVEDEEKIQNRKLELVQEYETFKEQKIEDVRANLERQIAEFENEKQDGKGRK